MGLELHHVTRHAHTHISRGHSVCANMVGFGTFPGFCELLVQNFVSLGGGYVYTFRNLREKAASEMYGLGAE